MYRLENDEFTINLNESGKLINLFVNNDRDQMNWVISEEYLKEHGYEEFNKLFGSFELRVNGDLFTDKDQNPEIESEESNIKVSHRFADFEISMLYSLQENNEIEWNINLVNKCGKELNIESFSVWFPLAYIMFRDKNVKRNMSHSCAVFPHLSTDYTKFAAIKRSNHAPHLGIYNTTGKTVSLGSYCVYQNLFKEQTSPSLDGSIFHQLILLQDKKKRVNQEDWIYEDLFQENSILAVNNQKSWSYKFRSVSDEEDFYEKGKEYSFPIIDYSPVISKGKNFEALININKKESINKIWIDSINTKKILYNKSGNEQKTQITINERMDDTGEHKLNIEFETGKIDFVIFSVMEPFKEILTERLNYLARNSWANDKNQPYAFAPVSNQGESLGKLNFILEMALQGNSNLELVKNVERSAVNYINPKWFDQGDFKAPLKIYGGFYRIFDYDYIAHVYYLLSKFDKDTLQINEPLTYLNWSADLLINRFDIAIHHEEREKSETRLTGVFTLYIQDLLNDLKTTGLIEKHERLLELWKEFTVQLVSESKEYKAAITEHYYDNAGFGPACASLCLSGEHKVASKYAELLKANSGFSNDFRNQNPDRWWEALAYMAHSLWGGLVSYSTLVAYEHLKDKELLLASYRTMLPVFYCYDWTAQNTPKKLSKGEAASTYCVTNPNINMESLSHNRFGQSVFEGNEGILEGNATGNDWDMGEELVAYLKGFGTKTYLIYKDEKIQCVNGYLEEQENGDLLVKSYAAYPREYHFFEEDIAYKVDGSTVLNEIILSRDNNKYSFKEKNHIKQSI